MQGLRLGQQSVGLVPAQPPTPRLRLRWHLYMVIVTGGPTRKGSSVYTIGSRIAMSLAAKLPAWLPHRMIPDSERKGRYKGLEGYPATAEHVFGRNIRRSHYGVGAG